MPMTTLTAFLVKCILTLPLFFWVHNSKALNPCAQISDHPATSKQLFLNPEAKASALVVHGLNNSFHMMNDLVVSLQEMNLNTYNVALSGHKGRYSEFESATKENWVADVLYGYCQLKRLGAPIIFIGYSLGGLLGPYLKIQQDAVDFAAFVFLAPAMAIHKSLDFLSWLRIFGGDYSLPARAPKNYRLYSKVPISAYWEYLKIKEAFTAANLRKLKVPGLVLVDPRDELVSSEGLRQLIRKQGLADFWDFIEVKSQHKYKHIIIDQKSLGESQWVQLTRLIQQLSISD